VNFTSILVSKISWFQKFLGNLVGFLKQVKWRVCFETLPGIEASISRPVGEVEGLLWRP
jgi:hypothetical protein